MVAVSRDRQGSLLGQLWGYCFRDRGKWTLVFVFGAVLMMVLLTVISGNHEDVISRGTLIAPSSTSSIRGVAVSATYENNLKCRFFLAESAIPRGGLGLFTAIDIRKGEEAQSMPDICVYVADTPDGTHFETHSWARDVFMGTFEGRNPRGACEGFATLFNTMPDTVSTSKLVSMKMHTNAGLQRRKDPGAGAVSHYYGITSEAIRDISAGQELTINYGDWEYDPDVKYEAPVRSVDWLRQHGMCIDNIKIKQATTREMGRGAFATRRMRRGTVVSPAPLQTFRNRGDFEGKNVESLFINYCLQPKGTDILLFPYGPGVNMINHSSRNPNVALRWSTSSQHHNQWLDLPIEQFWKVVYPGALVLEVVALRDIAEGEELFMDYGEEWEAAWTKHKRSWKPAKGAKKYVYPADMDTSKPFRTLKEQKTNPYPKNLATVCFENNWDIQVGKPIEWTNPEWWPEGMTYCHVRTRRRDPKTSSWLYDVSLGFDFMPHETGDVRFIDKNVPHSAIMFIDLPYSSDMHLPNAFRFPIALPDNLLPSAWQSSRE